MNKLKNAKHEFVLDPKLDADCIFVADLSLSRLLLMNDKRYPWVILVPKRKGISEIHYLPRKDQISLFRETTTIAEIIEDLFNPRKLNIAAIGNIVSQLHIHIIGRNENDPAWPAPVWGHSAAVNYGRDESEELIDKLLAILT